MTETLQRATSTRGHRLPSTVRPVRYDLHIEADPAKPGFTGRVGISLDVAQPTQEITLHAKRLTLQSARLEGSGGGQTLSIQQDDAREEATLRATRPVTGTARLEITYAGQVAVGMAGLYLSKDGNESCLASQCEATDARAIVPCFDEPASKAVFAVQVTAPRGLHVLANGALAGRAPGPDGTTETWTFQPTPPMSSYLLALAIGPFAGTDAIEARGVPFRVWALAGKQRLGTHGRDIAAQMLPWYEDYFGQPYAFGKYDQVAVPSFAFGAMENAGLVVFRPSLLLLDPATASWDERKDVALVVAHEFAHMWFGDLVTMAWWDDLWLNEAFAEWMAHRCVAVLMPDLDVWAKFRARAAGAMATDALASTHSIYTPVETPAQAQELFDAITYGKGSATMRMLEQFLGEDAFRQGLQSYMAERRLGNATGADLWRHLGKASSQDVAAIMKDWVGQPGHPTVTCSWDAKADALRVRQHRTRSSPLGAPQPGLWRVPLVIQYEDDAGVHTERHLLAQAEGLVPLPVRGRLRWAWPNAQDVGFYRIAPDDALLSSLLDNARHLRPEERIGLLRDLWHQVRCGERGADAFMAAFARLLDAEAPYTVVQQAVQLLRGVERLLELQGRTEAVQVLRGWVGARLGEGYRSLGPSQAGEDPTLRERRAALLRAMAAIARDPLAVADARRIAAAERAGQAHDATLAAAAVAAEALNGDQAALELHLATAAQRRDAAAAPQDVERYLYVLPAFRDPALVASVLATLRSGALSPQAVGPILRAMLTEPHSQRAAWSHLQAEWASLREKLGEAWVAILVEACGELPPSLAGDVTAFFDANLSGAAAQAYARARERLAEMAEALPRVTAGLEAWIMAQAPGAANAAVGRPPRAVPQPS
ncbi:MAG TPA: M1 family metallopeptidase [Candidatus Thermoplasmatota archaeon]|nr:M1 family metallopeptidase [Candidatus Thermoplasmatota archaeon]